MLVTEYHEKGTLRNHLKHVTQLHTQAMISICLSIARGLTYLHTERFISNGKLCLEMEILSILSLNEHVAYDTRHNSKNVSTNV